MNKLLILFFPGLFSLICHSQTFEVDQIEQLFRPRLRVDSKYIFDSKFKDTSGVFNQLEGNTVFTFPIKTKLGAELKVDLSSLKLKDILQNSVRIKASQLLGMVRVNGKQARITFDSTANKNLLNVTAGILGVRLTKKYRLMFYSLNASFAEQDKTFNRPGARASGLIGQLHPRGLRKNFFYGIAATYSDGLFLPAAFFGGSEPIGKKFIFNYILPVQINFQYRNENNLLVTLGTGADGYRTGIDLKRNRVNLNYTSASVYTSVRYKFNRTFVGRVEGGYVFYQNIKYTPLDGYRTNFGIGPGVYVQAGFSILFGQTIWEKIAEGLIKN